MIQEIEQLNSSVERINNILKITKKYYTIDETTGKYCIYVLISPSGKCYVGQSKNVKKRWKSYTSLRCHSQPKLYNALKKYGPNNFLYKIIHLCETISDANTQEIRYMSLYDCILSGYNCREGGVNGKNDPESISKRVTSFISNPDNRGWHHSEESKIKISFGNKGKNTGKIRNLKSKLKQSKSISGPKHWNYGGTKSEDHKRKISESQRGSKSAWFNRKHTEETKRKIKLANIGRKHTDESKEACRQGWDTHHRNKKWKWLYILLSPENQIIYAKNLVEFCKNNNLRTDAISRVLSGKYKSHKGWLVSRIMLTPENNKLAIDIEKYPN
jgi:group I intron endonuclease